MCARVAASGLSRRRHDQHGRGAEATVPQSHPQQVQRNLHSARGSHATINQEVIRAAETKDARFLLSTIEKHIPRMNVVNLSTSVYRLGKLASQRPSLQSELHNSTVTWQLLRTLVRGLQSVEPQNPCLPQSISNVSWSLASLQLVYPELLEVLATLAVANMRRFKHYELSSTLWAYAKMSAVDIIANATWALFHEAAGFLSDQLPDVQMRCLATVAWAFATCRIRTAAFFRGMAAEICSKAKYASGQEISNTVWAFATASHKDSRLMHALGDAAVLRLHEFKPQEISNTMWGFATTGFFHPVFFERAVALLPSMELRPQHLANILWACSRVKPGGQVARVAVMTLLPRCHSALQGFKQQEVSSVMLAVSRIFGVKESGQPPDVPPPLDVWRFCASVEAWAVPRVKSFSDQSLANMLAAHASLALEGSQAALLLAMEQEVTARAPRLLACSLIALLKGLLSSQGAHHSTISRVAACLLGKCPLRQQDQSSLERVLMSQHVGVSGMPVETRLQKLCNSVASYPEATRRGDPRHQNKDRFQSNERAGLESNMHMLRQFSSQIEFPEERCRQIASDMNRQLLAQSESTADWYRQQSTTSVASTSALSHCTRQTSESAEGDYLPMLSEESRPFPDAIFRVRNTFVEQVEDDGDEEANHRARPSSMPPRIGRCATDEDLCNLPPMSRCSTPNSA